MRNKLMLIILVISAVALLFAWFSLEPPDATLPTDVLPATDDAQSTLTGKFASTDSPARDFERKYVVGRFAAPEQLQIAVYRAVNDELDGYVAYVNNMECDSGDCNIDIRIVAPTKVSAKSADLLARINAQLADNPLTRSIMAGIRSIQIDENRDGRLELVTMPAATSDDIATARLEFEQRMLEPLSSNQMLP